MIILIRDLSDAMSGREKVNAHQCVYREGRRAMGVVRALCARKIGGSAAVYLIAAERELARTASQCTGGVNNSIG